MRATQGPWFWDREFDSQGNAIRMDVREAAHKVWEKACSLTLSMTGDTADAADVMESCVARVSRRLNARNDDLHSQRTDAFLIVAFRHELYARVARLQRIQPIGATCEWGDRYCHSIEDRVEQRIDLVLLVSRMSGRGRRILLLRHAGYEWREVATLLGITVGSAKSSFWRELRAARARISTGHSRKVRAA